MAYEIEFITDDRFRGTKKKLQKMDKQLKQSLSDMSCVTLREKTGIRELSFGNGENKQWRKKYIISKKCRKPTWDTVMGKINKIQAPYYKRV